ncbi:Uncharacterised protein [Mycobacteroides abscessus subsp. abscessus]|nr:Uncharacterised protein [Mycobacteroides abscessus subsp. abscessus]
MIRDALEVDVLLTSRRETGDAHLRRDGDLVLRLDLGDGVDALLGDIQRLDRADLDAAQRDILIGQQTTGFRELNLDAVGAGERADTQGADRQIADGDQ